MASSYKVAPVAVSGGLAFQSVTTGVDWLTCGVTTAGAGYCWGNNDQGGLGDGTGGDFSNDNNSNVPVEVSGGLTFQSMSPGVWFSCGLTTVGDVYCWGRNSLGQLGDGTNTSTNVPVAVSGGLTFQTVSSGTRHSCGLTTAGVAYCWGANEGGALGIGMQGLGTESNVPVAVVGGLTFQSVDVGNTFTCGVTTAMAAYCWGARRGDLGDGNSGTPPGFSTVPVAVSGGLTFQAVSAGHFYGCGLTTAGDVYCWGASLGDVPSLIPGGLTFQSVSAGHAFGCGVTTAGDAYCWGEGGKGRLGDGLNSRSVVPVAVSPPF